MVTERRQKGQILTKDQEAKELVSTEELKNPNLCQQLKSSVHFFNPPAQDGRMSQDIWAVLAVYTHLNPRKTKPHLALSAGFISSQSRPSTANWENRFCVGPGFVHEGSNKQKTADAKQASHKNSRAVLCSDPM